MVWQQWVLFAYLVAVLFATILTIGDYRKPITPKGASVSVLIILGLIALVVTIK